LAGGLNGVAARLAAQEGRLRELNAHSARLTAPLREAAAQEERNRLARDLHDTIKQQLFSIGVTAAAAEARWEADPPGARAALADIRALAGEAQVEMRALLTQLRPTPVAQIGLLAALREQLSALAYRAEVAIEADLRPLPDGLTLQPGAEDALFRIAQEGLANIARHARARNVRVAFGPAADPPDPGVAELTLRDDGQGFDPAATEAGSGMGLRNMRARAAEIGGSLAVTTSPSGGTTLVVRVPVYLSPAIVAGDEQEVSPMDRYEPELRRYTAFRALGAAASVAFVWSVVTLALRPDWPRPSNLLALGLLVVALGASIWADQLGRRFWTVAGDERGWKLRLDRINYLTQVAEYALLFLLAPVMVTFFFRGASLAGLGALAVGGATVVYLGMLLWALWRLVQTERALSATVEVWATREQLDAERTQQVTQLTMNLVLLVLFSSFLRTQVPSDPATLEDWLRATAAYPLIALAAVAGWNLVWTHQRLQRLTGGGTRETTAG
jgi:hypothetical protein